MGSREESIQKFLVNKFAYLADKVKVSRDRRMWADAPQDKLEEVLRYAQDELDFAHLATMTGLDETANFAFIYHLTRNDGVMLSVKITVPKDRAVIKTVTDRFPGAEIYEREVVDLLGVKVEGLAEGRRYPLPDDWPAGEYPLRKDWRKK
jgi:Ni,Fe-hydrogenase III component G